MKLLLLGTTGYHPNERRHTACFMLPEMGVVLDAGTAMFRARAHLRTPNLDIFLTHAHLDHIVGLTYLFDVLHDRPIDRARVHGEQDKLAQIRQHLFSQAIFPAAPPISWCPLTGSWPLARGGQLTHFPLDHPGGSVGYRLEWPGHTMAYVTDTLADPAAPYVHQIRGVDLLIHECYFSNAQQDLARLTGHSWTGPVAQVAKAAQVGQMVLVHANPLSEEEDPVGLHDAQAVFPNTALGVDNMVVEF